ncbi:hypothetical protein [Terricaulis sp.]|uniref:hypothetical protein n=1 Tax=Terricaulis sp. TaxID=2768686 RepID=UPI0037852929
MTRTQSPQRAAGVAPGGGTFLSAIKLTHVYLVAWVMWFGAFLLTASEPYSGQSLRAILVVGGGILAVFAGLAIFEPKQAPKQQPLSSGALVRMRLCALAGMGLGALGVLFRGVDWFVIRGIGIGGDMMANREALLNSSGPLSIVAAGLIPFTIVAPVLNGIARRQGLPMVFPVSSVLLALIGPLMAIAVGSRSSLLFMAIMYMFCALLFFRPSARLLTGAVMGALALFAVSTIVFVGRADEMGMDIRYSARYSVYTQMVPTQPHVLDILDSAPPAIAHTVFGAISVAQYLCHGVFEATYIVDNFGERHHSDGLYTFEYAAKVANMLPLVDIDMSTLAGINPRQGAFATLFGNFFIDFGDYAPLACFVFGLCAALVRARAVAGDWLIAPLYVVVASQVAMSIVTDPFCTAAMIYWDMGLLAFWIAARAFVFSHEPLRISRWRPA